MQGYTEEGRDPQQMLRDGDDGTPDLDIEELVGDEAPDPLIEAGFGGVEFDQTPAASDDSESEDGR